MGITMGARLSKAWAAARGLLYLSIFLTIWIGAWLIGNQGRVFEEKAFVDDERLADVMRGRVGYIDENGTVYTTEGNVGGVIGFFCGVLITAGVVSFVENRLGNGG